VASVETMAGKEGEKPLELTIQSAVFHGTCGVLTNTKIIN
jgi:hypothetical protein